MNLKNSILLICNSFPFSGEPFLKTEAGLMPEDLSVDVWPFFVHRAKGGNNNDFPNVTPHIYAQPTTIGKIKCLLNAFCVFLQEREFKAALSKKGFIRNTVKAVKFAYRSEIRLATIRKWLRDTGFTDDNPLIYSYWMYETAYVAAKLKKWHSNSKFVTRCHGYDLYGERHANGYLPFRQFIMDQADLICPISESGKSYLHDTFSGKYDEKISVMRLGTIRKAEIPEKQEKEESIVLVSCSNLVDVKRVHLIINALKKCQKQITWYHFGDGELRASLERQAEVLPENIRYMFMGYQANDDVQRFYALHYIDAFVNVSQSEGIPVSIMEAESYGIPIIATDVGGTSEIVHNGENGVLLNVEFSDEELLMAIDVVVEKADSYRAAALRTWQSMSDAHMVFPEFYKKMAEV